MSERAVGAVFSIAVISFLMHIAVYFYAPSVIMYLPERAAKADFSAPEIPFEWALDEAVIRLDERIHGDLILMGHGYDGSLPVIQRFMPLAQVALECSPTGIRLSLTGEAQGAQTDLFVFYDHGQLDDDGKQALCHAVLAELKNRRG